VDIVKALALLNVYIVITLTTVDTFILRNFCEIVELVSRQSC